VYTTAETGWLYGKEKWKNLCCIGAIKAEFKWESRLAFMIEYFVFAVKYFGRKLFHIFRLLDRKQA